MSGPKLFELFFNIHSWAFAVGIYVHGGGWPRFWAQLGPVVAALDLTVFDTTARRRAREDSVS